MAPGQPHTSSPRRSPGCSTAIWTFRGLGSGPVHQQWVRFLGVNLGGFVLNRGTYAILVTFVPLCAQSPSSPVGAGAIAGMFLNSAFARDGVP